LTIDPRHISIFTLDENDLHHMIEFDCDDPEMNRFFQEECLDEQEHGLNKTYVLYYREELAAFCSICADRISLTPTEKDKVSLPRNSVPAVKIARLGREKRYKTLMLGKYLVEYIQLQVLKVSEESIGIRFITLDAYPHRVSYYESIGFLPNLQQDARKETVSMRFDIFTAALENEQMGESTA
jgi:hypothetical protein